MIKFIGGIIILVAGTFIGYIQSRGPGIRVNSLEDIKSLLCELHNDMRLSYSCLGDIFNTLTDKRENPACRIFGDTLINVDKGMSFGESWKDAIKSERNILRLTGDDVKILEDFGNMLGQTDIEGQDSGFRLTFQRLEAAIEEARDIKKKFSGLYLYSGIGVGITIVMLLI